MRFSARSPLRVIHRDARKPQDPYVWRPSALEGNDVGVEASSDRPGGWPCGSGLLHGNRVLADQLRLGRLVITPLLRGGRGDDGESNDSSPQLLEMRIRP